MKYVFMHAHKWARKTNIGHSWNVLNWEFSINPSYAGAIFVQSSRTQTILKSKPCHVDIHWIPLAEYSQMSIQMPEFHSFFYFWYHFVLVKLATNSLRVNGVTIVTKSLRNINRSEQYFLRGFVGLTWDVLLWSKQGVN